ncbi:hypothetical protein K1719_016692 [Acacia pycnantha]|nr:hypothetical protein K1719_016692 [Acacia pycnantha]
MAFCSRSWLLPFGGLAKAMLLSAPSPFSLTPSSVQIRRQPGLNKCRPNTWGSLKHGDGEDSSGQGRN